MEQDLGAQGEGHYSTKGLGEGLVTKQKRELCSNLEFGIKLGKDAILGLRAFF